MIWAVILAAGESRRMGTQKLLLPFGETTVVGAVVGTALASRVDRVLAVLGADREDIRRELEPLGIDLTVNEDYAKGMLSSVQAGFRALPADAEAAVVMLGDQPFLPARVVDAVVEAFRRSGGGIVVPAFQGRRGHPVLVDLKYRDEVLALDPADGLRRLMRAHPEDIFEAEVEDANILRDMDVPEDYAGVKPGGQDGAFKKGSNSGRKLGVSRRGQTYLLHFSGQEGCKR
ncbi:MAG: nucleotidyltransferase family protein [Candidatus Aminicenantes bacterium]|nr:nucleotidyltransferase family protein [Candidatus Aminicenantes bacterium]